MLLKPTNVIIMISAYPFVMLPIFRFFMLRKARGLSQSIIKRKGKKSKDAETIIEK